MFIAALITVTKKGEKPHIISVAFSPYSKSHQLVSDEETVTYLIHSVLLGPRKYLHMVQLGMNLRTFRKGL
jgi:hypothetical protein